MEAITTLATVPAVLAIVNLIKSTFGIRGNYSALIAIFVGVGINVCNFALGDFGWYQAAIQGLILALGAAGLNDVSKTSRTQNEIAATVQDYVGQASTGKHEAAVEDVN